ncbi:hypothetical protein B566_EDAN007898 [Ephemera danica]|nr:hypothetical protein B566_EDAN007898 [Ephemera danica]
MKMFKSWESVLSALMIAVIVVLLVDPSDAAAVPSEESGEWKIVSKVLDECMSQEKTADCLGIKATAFLQRASRASVIPVVTGITLIKDVPDDSRSGRALSESEIENSLPTEASERSGRVVDMVLDSAVRFLQSHTLQFKLPAEDVARSLESGRGKIKKLLLPLLLGGGFKFLLIPLAIGAIALMAFKALAIGKLALLIAAAVGAQKFFGGYGSGIGGLFGGKTKTIEVVSHPVHSYSSGGYSSGAGGYSGNSGYTTGGFSASSGSGGWNNNARTLDTQEQQQEATQKLVFRAHAPSSSSQQ